MSQGDPSGLPSAAGSDSPTGAAIFANSYLAAVDKAFIQGNKDGVKGYSVPECNGCVALFERLRDMQDNQWHALGPLFGDLDLKPTVESGDTVTLEAVRRLPDVTVVDRRGAELLKQPGRDATVTVHVIRVGSKWKVSKVDGLQP